nr:hypothetical protein [Tanacetum cinerariifolium]
QDEDDADEETDVNDDSEETKSDNDGDNLTHPNLSTYKADDKKEEEEEKENDEEMSSDKRVSTPPEYELTKEEEEENKEGIVDNYLASKMKEVVDVAFQQQTTKLREEAQDESQEFLNQVDSTMKTVSLEKSNKNVISLKDVINLPVNVSHVIVIDPASIHNFIIMSNTNNNMQTQTSNTLHNGIMEAGSKDRPQMLAPGNYVQWKSRIKRYIDTKPNHELIHHCLKNPPYKFTWVDKEILISEGSPDTRTESQMEAYKTVSQDIRDQLNAKAKAV